MKRRFRTFVRSGWYLAEVPRTNLWRWQEAAQSNNDIEWGSEAHYRHIRSWCHGTFGKNTWEGRMLPTGCKEFVFQKEKDRTLFLLKFGS